MATISLNAIQLKSIPGANPNSVKDAIRKALNEKAKQILGDFHRTTEYWKTEDIPEFHTESVEGGDEMKRTVWTSDYPYKYVSQGTNVRHAVMSRGFIAKTVPGIIASGPGQGEKEYVDKKFLMNGITPREFDKNIAEVRLKSFQSEVQDAINRVVK